MVNQILRTIQASQVTREINSRSTLMQRVGSVAKELKEKENAERLSHSEEGSLLVQESYNELSNNLSQLIAQINVANPILGLNMFKPPKHFGSIILHVVSNGGFHVISGFRGLGLNYTYETQLTVSLGKRKLFGMSQESEEIRKMEFQPTFKLPKKVVWVDGRNKDKFYSSSELAEFFIEMLVEKIGEQTR